MTLNTDSILIFDLDGTILSVNSFPYWVLYMLTGHFGGLTVWQRTLLTARTGRILAKRKLLRQSHAHTKQQLQELWTKSLEKDETQEALNSLNSLLQTYVRPNMAKMMSAVAQKRFDALMATSAAGEYALRLGESFGFEHVITTPLHRETDRSENSGQRKCDRVLAKLAEQGWNDRKRIFFTDHEEDLPLIRECEYTLWFGRDEDVAALQASTPQTKIIACRHLSNSEVIRLAGNR